MLGVASLLLFLRRGRAPPDGADERLASPFSPLQLQVKLRELLGAEAVGGG